MTELRTLPAKWRERAETLRPFAAPAAQAFEDAASELDEAINTYELEALNLRQAADESGYCADYLGRLVKAGEIPNAGRKGAPRIRRKDLPRKALKPTETDGRFEGLKQKMRQARVR